MGKLVDVGSTKRVGVGVAVATASVAVGREGVGEGVATTKSRQKPVDQAIGGLADPHLARLGHLRQATGCRNGLSHQRQSTARA